MVKGGSGPSGVAALRPKAAAKRKRAECTEIETLLKRISSWPLSSKQWEIAQEMAEQQEMGVAEHYSWDMVVHEALAAAQKVQDEEVEQIQEPEAGVQTSQEA